MRTPKIDSVALLAFILLATLIGMVVSDRHSVAAPQQADPPAIVGTEFRLGWVWEIDDADPKDHVLVVDYEDGRHYLFRDKSITAIKFYPTKIAANLGNPHAYIEIFCGASTTRLDVTNDAGRDLVARLTTELTAVRTAEQEALKANSP